MRRVLLPAAAAIAAALAAATAAVAVAEEKSPDAVDFVREVRPVLQAHCYSCHGEKQQKSGLRLDIKSEAFRGGELYDASILPGKPDDSPLYRFVADEDADLQMPPEGERLGAKEIAALRDWIAQGAVWPDDADLAKLEDRADHWSFKPVRRVRPPAVRDESWIRDEIDRFVLARLEREGLRPRGAAGRASWLRRVSLGLTGLPPTPAEVAAFAADQRPDAFERVVDRLLHSVRYGERWAQHWLDVVRYADTHGFEVNTERPHAWPYRDYVIEALNRDLPYDQFVRQQIAGDALGSGEATGFLVTASVLLPGQIGKDAASKRLARQDSLDEIVVNIGQTFLGLSVGCARCHDHKFDPISQRDYYSMQAFVAGVEYADRELQGGEAGGMDQQRRRAEERLAEIEQELQRFVPPARPGTRERRKTSPEKNVEQFEPVVARFVRFTIHDANLHPTLGLIEPCIDEFEIFTAGAAPRNVALAGEGTKVTASGSRTSDIHRLEHVHDGRYGNGRSWMADEAGRGWLLFELPRPMQVDRVVWSRDREGRFDDRLATAYTLEAGMSLDTLQTLTKLAPLRPAVNPLKNVDRFEPVVAKRLRFTVLKTSELPPCLDELEVFDEAGVNVASDERGTTATSSGDAVTANRHQLEFLNDGEYGNSRSWLSVREAEAWVELEFPEPTTIERVVWSRDRQGKFTDRLAVDYRIEAADAAGRWRTVADASDREPYDPQRTRPKPFSLAGLGAADQQAARRLEAEKKRLEAEIARITESLQVFAGKFRRPDEIHLLRRGDPEQPVDRVAPAVLPVLGAVEMPMDAEEQRRRLALADWIASPDNPLTSRVMANRVWQGHFGVGLVETSNDFGRNGAPPTHPELLDYLAVELVRSGWSLKEMHRRIVLSATYRQASAHDPQAAAADGEARLLWRYPARRLEGEAIRDSILAVSGRLNLQMGGPGYNLFDRRGGLTGFQPIESFSGDGLRRMIYAHKVRRERDAVFGAFDCPDAGQSTPLRRESTTPIQALNLLNSKFVLEQSEAMARRAAAEAGDDLQSQIGRAYELALCRTPTAAEMADVEPVVRQHGLPLLCRVLLNSNEFLMIP